MDQATWNGSTTRPATLSSPTSSRPSVLCTSNSSTKKMSPLARMATTSTLSPVAKSQNQESPSPSLSQNRRTVCSVPKSTSLPNNITSSPPPRAIRDSLCATRPTLTARNVTLQPRVSTMLFTDGRMLPRLDKDHRRRARDMAVVAVQMRTRSGTVAVVFRP